MSGCFLYDEKSMEEGNSLGRARSPDSEKAEELYKQGISLVEIASQLNISDGTVRSWKNRYKWENDPNATLQKNKRNVAKKKAAINKADADTVECAIINSELTDKQQLFCLLYVKYRNKTEAYQEAYECSYRNACSNASTLWKKSGIQKEVNRLLEEYRSNIDLDIKDLFQWHLDIARADITKFVDFGTNEITDTDSGGKIKYSYVNLKDCKDVNGLVIAEVSKGRDGAKIKLNDRSKSLDWLDAHIGLANERQKAEIEQIKANTERIKNGSDPDDDEGVEIINDAPKETGEDIRNTDSEVSTDI